MEVHVHVVVIFQCFLTMYAGILTPEPRWSVYELRGNTETC